MHYRLSSRSIRTRFEPCSDSYQSKLVAANQSDVRIVPFEELKSSPSVFIPIRLAEPVRNIHSKSRINHRRDGAFGSPPQATVLQRQKPDQLFVETKKYAQQI